MLEEQRRNEDAEKDLPMVSGDWRHLTACWKEGGMYVAGLYCFLFEGMWVLPFFKFFFVAASEIKRFFCPQNSW